MIVWRECRTISQRFFSLDTPRSHNIVGIRFRGQLNCPRFLTAESRREGYWNNTGMNVPNLVSCQLELSTNFQYVDGRRLFLYGVEDVMFEAVFGTSMCINF